MTAEEFIDAALEEGLTFGLDSLTGLKRTIFVISEVEVDSAMNGICAFAERRGRAGLLEAVDAFRRIGAHEVATALSDCAAVPTDFQSPAFDRANALVNDHVGWDYDAIARMVAANLSAQ